MREVWIDTLQAEAFDSVNQAPNDTVHHVSNDTIHPISNDTVHHVSNDTVHLGTIHSGTVHPMTTDTIQQASIDTTCGETERVEVVILKRVMDNHYKKTARILREKIVGISSEYRYSDDILTKQVVGNNSSEFLLSSEIPRNFPTEFRGNKLPRKFRGPLVCRKCPRNIPTD
ncbi:hypothetical protein DY000_02024245 [Brassica cretica]|uniref:Uncharacterized protein n=1 Tax=Brassica cretica TaxID=69181 RepID=A0ABQ7ED55_BRACR|nr:hypothetical protein DY000_02024245 [Brassica cretica]